MWILVAEAMGALGLFLFIVWWTLGPTQRREREALEKAAREAADGAGRKSRAGETIVSSAPGEPRR